jgi:hypothetical protein
MTILLNVKPFFIYELIYVCLKTPSMYQAKSHRVALRLVNQDSKMVSKVPPVG